MRKLAILTFTTLDNVMQAPMLAEEDRSGGFDGAGWAKPYWDEVMAQVGDKAMADPYEMLLGRRTYDVFSGAVTGDIPPDNSPMTGMKKFVATSRPETLTWANSQALTGDVTAGVAALKQQEGPLLQVHGSWRLIQTLLKSDLVDEMRLWVFPVILGNGKKLFEAGTPPRTFSLVETAATPNGVAMLIYRRMTDA
ncbi:MAG: dihydrofolate reductase family protein [Pseudomonadota bacterium]